MYFIGKFAIENLKALDRIFLLMLSSINSCCEKRLPRGRKIHEGKTKILFNGSESGTYILHFTSKSSGYKNSLVSSKGVLNNRISELFMLRLQEIGVPNHFIKRLNMNEQLVRITDPLPFRVVINHVAIGDFAKRLGLKIGSVLQEPILEFWTKNSDLEEALVSDQHINALNWATRDEIQSILEMIRRIDDFFMGQFIAIGMRLLNYSLEFGRFYISDEVLEDTQVILIDEVSYNNFSVLDLYSKQSDIDKRRISYNDFASRFGLLDPKGPPDINP
ncbi:MAG: phosphoribosylaminoimidazolesuccinocarboxamide synthase [Alphaproteobacteria bacterium]